LFIDYQRKSVFGLDNALKQYGIHTHHLDLDLEDIAKMDFETYELLILCLNRSEQENTQFFTQVRTHTSKPIAIIPKEQSEIIETYYLNHGADWYMSTTLKPLETSAQIMAFLRCIENQKNRTSNHQKRFGPFVFDPDSFEIKKGNTLVTLTTKEYELVKLFLNNRNRIISREKIVNHLYSLDEAASDNALNIVINRLRKKLTCDDGSNLIETIWGFGYRLNTSIEREVFK
jgi:DNA-binding response OmpR family regulator